ncbi:MAG: hypothetical protein ACYTKC_21540, partial [Planctomycetota bacterium]
MKKLPLLFPTVLIACSGIPTEMPPGEGDGLVTVAPQQPPAGTETFPRPKFQRGDRLVFQKGGVSKFSMRVIRADETGYDFKHNDFKPEGEGAIAIYDADLGVKEIRRPDAPYARQMRAPVDSTFTWPLWVGKRWTCIYLEKNPVMGAREIVVEYRADAIETIKVPAGTFRCVRIWRRSV